MVYIGLHWFELLGLHWQAGSIYQRLEATYVTPNSLSNCASWIQTEISLPLTGYMGVNQQRIASEYLPAHLMEDLLDICYQTRLVFLCLTTSST